MTTATTTPAAPAPPRTSILLTPDDWAAFRAAWAVSDTAALDCLEARYPVLAAHAWRQVGLIVLVGVPRTPSIADPAPVFAMTAEATP